MERTTERLPPKGGRFKTSGGLNRRLKAMLLKAGVFYHLRLRRLKNFSDNKLLNSAIDFILAILCLLLSSSENPTRLGMRAMPATNCQLPSQWVTIRKWLIVL
jgi:hypothetical protein